MLEVIDKGATSPSHPAPLLFVHGAWCAAWCWNEHFLGFFADNGYRALAISLRCHGNSSISQPLHTCTLTDYIEDVGSVAADLPTRPVVIGHSMGGLIVQKYLESHDAPAAVLMASLPPHGTFGSGLRWLKRHPWHCLKIAVTGRSLAYVNTPELARERFFSPNTPDFLVRKYAARLEEESPRVGVGGIRYRARARRVTAPLLVLGADHDGATTSAEVRATARAYGVGAEFFADMGHAMMLEPGWIGVAERIHAWLNAQGL